MRVSADVGMCVCAVVRLCAWGCVGWAYGVITSLTSVIHCYIAPADWPPGDV